MLIQDRAQAREFFFQVWEKLNRQIPLEPMESIIADVIQLHPEYHGYLEKTPASLLDDFKPEQGLTNPFLHMGLHIALREQVSTDRPAGISAVYHSLLEKYGSQHDVEHRMIDCLAESLWHAQKEHMLPDEQAYLTCLKGLY